MAFPQDVYRYADDTTRMPLTDLLTLYYGGEQSYYNARAAIFDVAVYHGDITSTDTTFSPYIDSVALSLNYVVLSGSDYVWKV